MSNLNLRRCTFLTIMLVEVLLLFIILRGCSSAPGAQPAPVRIHVGKVGSLHPGGAFQCLKILKHNVCFSDLDDHKLIPRLRLINHDGDGVVISQYNLLHGIYEDIRIYHNTNYIPNTSPQAPNKIWLVLSTIYPQTTFEVPVISLGMSADYGNNPHNRMLNTKTFVRVNARNE